MALSSTEISQLNNMCISAQNIQLGTEIATIEQNITDLSGGTLTVPAATSTKIGGVKQMALMSNASTSSATDVTTLVTNFNSLVTAYNSLLTALKNSGAMATS